MAKRQPSRSVLSTLIADGKVRPEHAREILALLKSRGWVLIRKRDLVLLHRGISEKVSIIIKLMEADLQEKVRKRRLIGLVGKL